jgi:hypothetical protein
MFKKVAFTMDPITGVPRARCIVVRRSGIEPCPHLSLAADRITRHSKTVGSAIHGTDRPRTADSLKGDAQASARPRQALPPSARNQAATSSALLSGGKTG